MKMLLSLFFIAALVSPTMVSAVIRDDGAEEMTYDDLVNALASKQKRLQKPETSAFDDVRVHAGFGLVNSFSTFEVAGKKGTRYQNGLQLSAGVDLFSPNWFAETAFRNFGQTSYGTEEHNLRELDLKFGYRDQLDKSWSYRLQAGLADRTLHLTDPAKNISIDDTTPNILGSGGISLDMSQNASLSFDAAIKSPVVGRTADKGAFDFAIDFKLSL